jgi:hypothetical protein
MARASCACRRGLSPARRQLLEALARELGEDVQPAHKSFMEKLRELFD